MFRYYNSWIEVEEAPESETSSNETKSSSPEEKPKSTVEDSLLKLNVVEAPSISASREDDSWASGRNRPNSEGEENSYSSSSEEEEITKPKQSSNITESSEDIMFRNLEESFIQFGSSLAGMVGISFEIHSIIVDMITVLS